MYPSEHTPLDGLLAILVRLANRIGAAIDTLCQGRALDARPRKPDAQI